MTLILQVHDTFEALLKQHLLRGPMTKPSLNVSKKETLNAGETA